MNNSIPKPTWGHRIVSFAGWFYLQLVGKTSFFKKWDHPAYLEYRRDKKPCLYALWHNSQVMLAYAHRGEGVAILVSRSKDGEYIAQVMKKLGLVAPRGSSSRGGEQALREIIDIVKSGGQAGFTPDGPKGPALKVDGGIIAAARLSGVPIIPVGAYSRRKYVFRSWDRFVLPLPFGHNVIAHGAPLWIGPDSDDDASKEKIRQALNQLAEEAKQVDAASPSWFFLLGGTVLFWIYNFSLVLLSPFLFLAFLFVFGTKRTLLDLKERWKGIPVSPPDRKRLWFHAASLGEWQALKPLLARFISEGLYSLIVTTSAPEVRGLIKKEHPELSVSLLPIDLSWVERSWIKKVAPFAVVLLETELWPNLIDQLERKNIPTILVNGRLSQKSIRGWRWARTFIQRILSQLTWILCRTDEDRDRFEKLGAYPTRLEIKGNTKSDNLHISTVEMKKEAKANLLGLHSEIVIIGGSTWPSEEEILLRFLLNKKNVPARLILAPRRLERLAHICELAEKTGRSYSLYSDVKLTRLWTTEVLLVDTFGDLKDLYQASDIGFIGGSVFPRGGQNPLEPAAAELPLLIGPHMENFSHEARQLLEAGGAFTFKTELEFLSHAASLLHDENLRLQMGEAAAQTVRREQGASEAIHNRLTALLSLQG